MPVATSDQRELVDNRQRRTTAPTGAGEPHTLPVANFSQTGLTRQKEATQI
jgi:hypothetical protein